MEKPHLEIRTALGRTQLVLSGHAVTIGRHSDNRIVVQDGMASRFHCVIEKTADGYLLRDLGSSNGTMVNGRRVRSTILNNGDAVTIGSHRMILVLPDAPPRDGGPPARPTVYANAPAGDDADPIPLTDADELADDDAGGLELADLEALATPAARDPESEPVEELSEADLVEDVGPPAGRGDGPIPIAHDEDDAADYEHALRSLADSLPDRTFGVGEISLFNPRGQPVAEGGRGASDGPANTTYLLRLLLLACLRSRATDLHLEAKGEFYQARLRVDGIMVDAAKVPNEIGGRLAGAVKVVSDIDPSQKNIVQEGHFAGRVPGGPTMPYGSIRRIDFRVSFAPAVFGQKLVLRILDPGSAPAKVGDLQLPADVEKELRRAVEQESGMVLVAGPTGSGKTSSLYALLRSINLRERNVVTIEDPVEIQIEGATQLPVDDEKGNTFPNLLRSVLRQDPDVILVGEIRDAETARIAMQAAITGHLVFSTVHTKDAVGTVFRLLDLGVEPYLLAQGLHVVLAQRLVRKLCPNCKVAQPLTPEQAARMGPAAEGLKVTYVPGGCRRCLGTGFAGRRAFVELLSTSDALREAISRSPSLKDISQALAETPFRRLSQAGFQLVADGVVSYDEIEKTVGR